MHKKYLQAKKVLFLLSGQGKFGKDKTPIKAGQIGHLSKTSLNEVNKLTVVADDKLPSSLLRFLLWTGKPLHQPVVAYGPFVMNTKEQIDEAFTDYRNGVFHFNSKQQQQIVTMFYVLIHKSINKR